MRHIGKGVLVQKNRTYSCMLHIREYVLNIQKHQFYVQEQKILIKSHILKYMINFKRRVNWF